MIFAAPMVSTTVMEKHTELVNTRFTKLFTRDLNATRSEMGRTKYHRVWNLV